MNKYFVYLNDMFLGVYLAEDMWEALEAAYVDPGCKPPENLYYRGNDVWEDDERNCIVVRELMEGEKVYYDGKDRAEIADNGKIPDGMWPHDEFDEVRRLCPDTGELITVHKQTDFPASEEFLECQRGRSRRLAKYQQDLSEERAKYQRMISETNKQN